ncbi:MAG: hypothetical protein OXF44_14070 [Anaerolineaceae bacterium]|nr:hypothetical protein [Anaerolineaceae bacterium]
MNTRIRNLLLTTTVLAALVLGAGLITAQEHGGGAGEEKSESVYRQRGIPVPAVGMELMLLASEATGLTPEELNNAMREGDTIAGLIEANGGDVEAFVTEATDLVTSRMVAQMRARIEALVYGEFKSPAEGRGGEGAGEHGGRGRGEGAREHGAGAGEGGPGPGEESGATYTLDETFDTVRNGVRLVMSWDANAEAFVGVVENVTDATIPAVRVEVHLSNGVELGPTPRADLAPGETRAVELSAAGITGFDGWTPHAEMGAGDSGGGEGAGEHGASGEGGEGGGEHGGRGEGGSG